MSSTVTLNNITHTVGSNTLIIGEIQINTHEPGSIDILPIATPDSAHIILQKSDDVIFKNIIQKSPVRDFDITLYDQRSYTTCRYDAGRKDNKSGTVRISDSKDLLSNIDFPKITSGQLYLVISRYEGLEQLSIPFSKKQLLQRDLDLLGKKVNTEDIILFISAEIYAQITSLEVSMNFKQIYTPPRDILIKFLVEYLVGKNIAGSKPSFQGMLKFGEHPETKVDTDVVMARFTNYESINTPITAIIRRGGRIQINSESKDAHSRFFILLKHSSHVDDIKITEEITESEFPIVRSTPEHLPDITDRHFKCLIDSINFMEKLNFSQDREYISRFISENLPTVSEHIFMSPLGCFDTIEPKSELVTDIIKYGILLRTQIFQTLSSFASVINQPKSKKPAYEDDNIYALFGQNSLCTTVPPPDLTRQHTKYVRMPKPSVDESASGFHEN